MRVSIAMYSANLLNCNKVIRDLSVYVSSDIGHYGDLLSLTFVDAETAIKRVEAFLLSAEYLNHVSGAE